MFLVLKVCKLSNADENVVLILARCLPHIVPNVLLNKREVRNVKSRQYCTTASRKAVQQNRINVHLSNPTKDIMDNGGLKLKVFQPDKSKLFYRVYSCFLLGLSCLNTVNLNEATIKYH